MRFALMTRNGTIVGWADSEKEVYLRVKWLQAEGFTEIRVFGELGNFKPVDAPLVWRKRKQVTR